MKRLFSFSAALAIILAGVNALPANATTAYFSDNDRSMTLNPIFLGGQNGPDLLVNLYISGVSYSSWNSSSATNLSLSNFDLTSNRLSAAVAPDVATYVKDTANGLSISVRFNNLRSQLCNGDTIRLNIKAPTAVPVQDNSTALLLPVSYALNFTPNSLNSCAPLVNQGGQSESAPKYAGPEVSSFGAPILAGDKLVSQGKRLDGITSLKINGAAATYKINSASELEIDVPKDLAPGKYDIEITSTHGKLTHLQAFTVNAVVPTKTLEFKGDGRTLGYEELLELTKIAKQIGAEYTFVKCIVNEADAAVAQRLVSRGCDYVGAIRLRGKEVSTEAKSTYKGDGYWFKIVANG